MKPTLAPRFLGAIVLFCALSTPVWAGLFGDDQTKQDIADMKAVQGNLNKEVQDLLDRIGRLEASNQNLPEMVSQFENMTQSMADIKGKLDELNNRLDQITKRNQDLYLDLDSRLKVLEGGKPTANTDKLDDKAAKAAESKNLDSAKKKESGAQVKAADQQDPQDKKEATQTEASNNKEPQIKEMPAPKGPSYDSGLNAFNAGKYDESVKLLKGFIKANPEDDKVPNAYFWIGLNDLVLKNYKEAVEVNQKVIKEFPKSSKVPDAMLNLSRAYKALGESAKEKAILHQLMTKYPDSEAANKAKKHHS